MAEKVPLQRLVQGMSHDLPDTTLLYIEGSKPNMRQTVELIAWE